jgi:hypothetical protein
MSKQRPYHQGPKCLGLIFNLPRRLMSPLELIFYLFSWTAFFFVKCVLFQKQQQISQSFFTLLVATFSNPFEFFIFGVKMSSDFSSFKKGLFQKVVAENFLRMVWERKKDLFIRLGQLGQDEWYRKTCFVTNVVAPCIERKSHFTSKIFLGKSQSGNSVVWPCYSSLNTDISLLLPKNQDNFRGALSRLSIVKKECEFEMT